jgi:cyanophycin synthetase
MILVRIDYFNSMFKGLTEKKKNLLSRIKKLRIGINVVSDDYKVVELVKGKNKRQIVNLVLQFNKRPGVFLCKNKHVTKELLGRAGISCPRGIGVAKYSEVGNKFKKKKMNFPVVVKPMDGAKGVGVNMNVKNFEQIRESMLKISKVDKNKVLGDVVIEEMIDGADYRLLVLNGKMIACCQRKPAQLVGDGRRTINQLISKLNSSRPKAFYLVVDKEVKNVFKKEKVNLNTVLEKNRVIKLRKVVSVSQGGASFNVTDQVSARFKKIAEEAVGAVELEFGGVDLMTADIRSNNKNQKYWILEINGAPQYEINEKPIVEGSAISVTDILLKKYMGFKQ